MYFVTSDERRYEKFPVRRTAVRATPELASQELAELAVPGSKCKATAQGAAVTALDEHTIVLRIAGAYLSRRLRVAVGTAQNNNAASARCGRGVRLVALKVS